MKDEHDLMENVSPSLDTYSQCDTLRGLMRQRVRVSLTRRWVAHEPHVIYVKADLGRSILDGHRTPLLLLCCILTFGVLVTGFVGTVRAQTSALTDSFTLDADLSGGDVVCASDEAEPLAVGTQMYIPVAGSWQVGWHSTFYVTFGGNVPSALQFMFRVFNDGVLDETVEYNVEPSLFKASTTEEFAFSVGTHGNDGNASGVVSSSPFYMTVQYYCLSTGQAVTVKGTSHMLQVAWPEPFSD